MSTNFISDTLKTYAINTFKNTFAVPNNLNIGLIFIGKAEDYANGIEEITNTDKDERKIWDNMIAAMEISPGDVELVLPKREWSANVKYKQFDDMVKISELSTADSANSIYSFFVYNSEGNVYKCLSNNNSSISTIEPTGVPTDGFVQTNDGYTWKYMYNIKPTNRFLTDNWMPVPYSLDIETTSSDYNTNESNLTDGTINLVIIENQGNNYFHKTHEHSYTSNSSSLVFSDLSNVATGMFVSGNGIIDGTYITSVSPSLSRIFISNPTIDSGSSYVTTTRIEIVGDGTGATASSQISNNSIENIEIITWGGGYSYANVNIYGTSNTAVARSVISSKGGHGYSPALELYATDMLIVKDVGVENDSTAGGVLPNDMFFRQYGILMNPHEMSSGEDITYSTANSVISQTTDITVTTGIDYIQYEYVYQGPTIDNSTFRGLVVSQSNNVIRLTNVKGDIKIGALLKGTSTSRSVISYKNPILERYTGDILYVNNIDGIERGAGQTEELKFVIKF